MSALSEYPIYGLKATHEIVRGPIVIRDGKQFILNILDKRIHDMLKYAIEHNEPISGGAIPLIPLEEVDSAVPPIR